MFLCCLPSLGKRFPKFGENVSQVRGRGFPSLARFPKFGEVGKAFPKFGEPGVSKTNTAISTNTDINADMNTDITKS